MQSLLTQVLLLAWVLCPISLGQTPPLPPVDDTQATTDLLPAGIIHSKPQVFGNYAYFWTLPDHTRVIQFQGDFSLDIGDRHLQSQDAVLWMQPQKKNDTTHYYFEVLLSTYALVRDSADTLTSAPLLLVTFTTTSPPEIHSDIHVRESSETTKLYQEAARIRQSSFVTSVPTSQPQGIQVYPTAPQPPPAKPEGRPTVRFRAREVELNETDGTVTAIGDVYVAQGLTESAEFLEIRAEGAVVFLSKPPPAEKPESNGPQPPPTAPGLEPFPPDPSAATDQTRLALGLDEGLDRRIAGVYLRGDVILTRGERMIRASELYYDFENDRALILDAVMRATAPVRNVPIYVRARQVRQLSTTEYVARDAAISASEFHTPHVHIGAREIRLTDVTPRDEMGQIIGLQAGKFEMRDTTLNLEGVPLAYWPYTAGSFQQSETSIRNVRLAYSDDFGATMQSKWYLFNLLGLEEPEGVDGTLRLDYFSERGPGIGTDVDYERDDAFGLLRGYYIYDDGEDNLGPFRDGELDTENRGRFTVRHRQYLPEDWELTLEASYISDPNFLEEYFNAEFEEGKEQETLLYLKKQRDNWAFTTLAQWRVLDFLTQTEHLPDAGFHWIGEPVADIANFYHESHLGFVRYKPDNRRLFDQNRLIDNTGSSDITFRGDTRNEIDLPVKLSALNLNLVPFASGRAGYWDSSPWEGSLDRLFGTAGLRAGSQIWRLFENASSEILDVHGVRHVIKPEAIAWASCSNRDSRDLYPFDSGIEDIDDFYGTSIALRQRWQTKRGGTGEWRKVDWITFDIELNLFGNAPDGDLPIGRFFLSRPESSLARNHVRADGMYRISDTTAVLSDANFDLTDGDLDLMNLSYAVERTPRFSYFVGYRRIHDTDSHLVGGGTNYEINTKYRLAFRAYYDLERNKTEQVDITIIRKFPRWYAALTLGLDQIEDDFGVGLSMWPEGAPQAAIGSRRYTSLSESTGIRPED